MKRIIIGIILILLFAGSARAEYMTDYDAEKFLDQIDLNKHIEHAKQIIITGTEIKGVGGISVDLPILAIGVTANDIYILDGSARAYRTGQSLLVEANTLHISAVYGDFQGKKSLLVAADLRTIANKILEIIKQNQTASPSGRQRLVAGPGKGSGALAAIGNYLQDQAELNNANGGQRGMTEAERVQYEEDCRVKSGDTFLTWHIKCGNTIAAERIIKSNRYAINEAGSDGLTPLMLAKLFKLNELADQLIEKGADVKAKDKNGNTAEEYSKAAKPKHIKLFEE